MLQLLLQLVVPIILVWLVGWCFLDGTSLVLGGDTTITLVKDCTTNNMGNSTPLRHNGTTNPNHKRRWRILLALVIVPLIEYCVLLLLTMLFVLMWSDETEHKCFCTFYVCLCMLMNQV